MCRKKEKVVGKIMTTEEVRSSAKKAAIRGGIEARARGTVMALTGEGDPTWLNKIQRRIEADIQKGDDPRGNFAQSGAAENYKK